MASPTEITTNQLSRLIGLPDAPRLIDVRIEDDYRADPQLIPGSIQRSHLEIERWLDHHRGQQTVIICQKGLKLSQGVAALLRQEGTHAETLEGGFNAWRDTGQLLLDPAKLPPRDAKGRTRWVTRARPKVDRTACPWLIRRFVDPDAVFLFVSPSEVEAVADRFQAAPFDIEGSFWSHRGERCTFDTMLEVFGLTSEPLLALAEIVRGADTGRLELTAESPGLLASCLGFSRMYRDDLEQLDASMGLYDSLYRWRRDASEETHDWPPAKRS